MAPEVCTTELKRCTGSCHSSKFVCFSFESIPGRENMYFFLVLYKSCLDGIPDTCLNQLLSSSSSSSIRLFFLRPNSVLLDY